MTLADCPTLVYDYPIASAVRGLLAAHRHRLAAQWDYIALALVLVAGLPVMHCLMTCARL